MGVTVQDLEKKKHTNNILYCEYCDAEYSATPGDYFWMDPNEIFTCECGEELELVQKKTSYVRV